MAAAAPDASATPSNRPPRGYVKQRAAAGDAETSADPTEIRVSAGSQSSHITQAIRQLEGFAGTEGKDDKVTAVNAITIRGLGNAIYNAVNIAEIVKRRVAGLHQVTSIGSEQIDDVFVPKEGETGEPWKRQRVVSTISIQLLKEAPANAASLSGYQVPIDPSLVEKEDAAKTAERANRPPRAPRQPRQRRDKDDKERSPKRDDERRPRRNDDRPRRGGRGDRDRDDDRPAPRRPRDDDRDEDRPRRGRGGGRRADRDDDRPRRGRGGGRRDDRDDDRPAPPRRPRDDRNDDRNDRRYRDERPRYRDSYDDDFERRPRAPRGRGGRDDYDERPRRGGYSNDDYERRPRGRGRQY